jgi:hypothetical protein
MAEEDVIPPEVRSRSGAREQRWIAQAIQAVQSEKRARIASHGLADELAHGETAT